jgi:hypothetical protein
MPRTARDMLLKLRSATFASADDLLAGVGAALMAPAALSRIARAGQIAVTAALPVVVTVATIVAELGKSSRPAAALRGMAFTAFAVYAGTFSVPMILNGIGALVTGSGFTFRPFGAMLVNKKGKRASRIRALWRAIVTWTPLVVTLMLFVFDRSDARSPVIALQCAVMLGMAAAAVSAILHPSRSIQDRLSGTWIVPR